MQMGLIVLVTQIVFLWLRTLNVKYTANDHMVGAMLTGVGIGLAWMVGIAIGANSMMEGHIFPIAMHIVGGTIGTYMGMRKKVRKFKRRKKIVTLPHGKEETEKKETSIDEGSRRRAT